MKVFKRSLLYVLLVMILFVLPSCNIIGGQTIYEDPEYVDFDPEPPAKDEAELETAYEDRSYLEAGNVRIYYEDSAANYAEDTSETVSSSSGDEMYGVAYPDFVFFNFSRMQAKVYVARVDLYESAADFAPGIIADIYRLMDGSSSFEECIPELPLDEFYHVCDHQQFVSNAKRIKFGNGSGVRFVTVYGIQDFAPVGNNNLLYVFQGFTDDGQYYVKVIVEMMHSSLEGMGELPVEVMTGTTEDIRAYFNTFGETFEENESGFTPDLDWIDEVIGALSFE